MSSDQKYMSHALRLAERGLGNTWPNPSVGAILIKDGVIVGRGHTQRGGRPHAETVALAQAGELARGAILYVTLEPCSHQGKTPPCTKAIIDAGIARVVGACKDPHPQVNGSGFKQLRDAGIEVAENICETEAARLNEGFFSTVTRKIPFVTIKTATSLDSKITREDSKNRWITSEHARKAGHSMRASHDAILTGIGTVLTDNPHLTCRLPGREMESPVRAVIDSSLRTPPDAHILPAWIFTSEKALKSKKKQATALLEKGARIFTASLKGKHLSLADVLKQLAKEGITRLMVEAGNELTTAFVEEKLADRIVWFRAPVIIGEKGLNAMNVDHLRGYHLSKTQKIGEDALEIYERLVV